MNAAKAAKKTIYVVEDKKGRNVKIIKRGTRWLYLEPRYGWDVPRVEGVVLDGEQCVVQGWSGAQAYASQEYFDECALRSRVWTAIKNTVQYKYNPPEDILTSKLQEFARLLAKVD